MSPVNNLNKITKYVMDTSALVRIFRFYPKTLVVPIWEKLESMFKSKQLFSHRLVYNEITTSSKEQDLLSEKVTPLKTSFKPIKNSHYPTVSEIITLFPGLIDPNSEKEEADPWLISMAIEENQKTKIYVVSEESERKKNKIPAVCKHYGVEHLNLERFFEEIGLEFNVSTKEGE